MRNSQIIDRSQHQIDEQAVGEENDEQEMMAMKMMGVRFCLAKTVTTKKSGCGKKKQKTVHSWSKGLQTV